jgi:hypothetical protein
MPGAWYKAGTQFIVVEGINGFALNSGSSNNAYCAYGYYHCLCTPCCLTTVCSLLQSMVTLDFIKIGLSGVLETLRNLINVVIW